MRFIALALQFTLLLSERGNKTILSSRASSDVQNENLRTRTKANEKTSQLKELTGADVDTPNKNIDMDTDETLESTEISTFNSRRLRNDNEERRNVVITDYGLKYKINPPKKHDTWIQVKVQLGYKSVFELKGTYPPYVFYRETPYDNDRTYMFENKFCYEGMQCGQYTGTFSYVYSWVGEIIEPVDIYFEAPKKYGGAIVSAWLCQNGIKGDGLFSHDNYRQARKKQKRGKFTPVSECAIETAFPSEVPPGGDSVSALDIIEVTSPTAAPVSDDGNRMLGMDEYKNVKIYDDGVSYKVNPPRQDKGWIDIWMELGALGEFGDEFVGAYSARTQEDNYKSVGDAALYLTPQELIPVETSANVTCCQFLDSFNYTYMGRKVEISGYQIISGWICTDGIKGAGIFSEDRYFEETS